MTRRLCLLAAILVAAPALYAQTVAPKKPKIPGWDKIGKEMKLLTTTEGFWNLYVDKERPPEKMYVEIRNTNKPFLLATSIAGGTTQAKDRAPSAHRSDRAKVDHDRAENRTPRARR